MDIIESKNSPSVAFDVSGEQILNTISKANRFNQWMYDTIVPYCKGDILEIGSGIGNISDFFIKNNYSIVLSDVQEAYCEFLNKKYTQKNTIKTIDLVDVEFDKKQIDYFNRFDTIFALNVIEHIEDDSQAIANCYKLLKKSGQLIILVPAYPFLYNNFDTGLGHYKRYTRKTLNKLLNTQKFEGVHSRYFNFMGIVGWFISGKLQRHKTTPKSQMKLYNNLVPLFKIMDKIVLNKAGLSIISIGKK